MTTNSDKKQIENFLHSCKESKLDLNYAKHKLVHAGWDESLVNKTISAHKREKRKNLLIGKQTHKKTTPKNKFIRSASLMLALLIVLFLGLNYPGITGLVVEGAESHTQQINLEFSANQEYDWDIIDSPEEFYLTSLGISGSVIGEGNARVYLIDGAEKYIIFDGEDIDTSPSSITGLMISITGMSASEEGHVIETSGDDAAEEPAEEVAEDPETPVEDIEGESTPADETELNVPESQEGEESSASESNETEEAGNESAEAPIADSIEDSNETEELINNETIGEDNVTSELLLNETTTINDTTALLEETNLTEETIIEEGNITEELIEANVTTEVENVQRFSSICKDTCTLPAGNLNETNYKLIIEVEEGTTLNINSIHYSLRNLAEQTAEIEFNILDSEGESIPASFEIEGVDEELFDGNIIYLSKEKKYNITSTFEEHTIKSLVLNQVSFTEDTYELATLYEDLRIAGIPQSYAIQPAVDYESIKLTVEAKGSKLYRCDRWNFRRQRCRDDFKFHKLITQGEEYEVEVSANTLAFIESESEIAEVSYLKIKNDARYDAIIDSSVIDSEGTLEIIFHHDSEEPLPIRIIGKLDYSLSSDIAQAHENITLTVPDYSEDKFFRIKVGNNSEAFEFGKPEKYVIIGEVKDAQDERVDSRLYLRDAVTNKRVRTKRNDVKVVVKEGIYDVDVRPKRQTITRAYFEEVEVFDDVKEFIKLDKFAVEDVELENYEKVYAIDPTAINFTSAKITARRAKGKALFKCTSWDFANKVCPDDNWTFVQKITPRKKYDFTLTPEDPAFSEVLPFADTMIISSPSNKNYGASPELEMQDNGNTRILIKFDLGEIPDYATITDARLEFYVSNANRDTLPAEVDIYRVSRSWREGTGTSTVSKNGATWVTYNGRTSWTPGGAIDDTVWGTTAVTEEGWYTWDIKQLVQSMVYGDKRNYGVLLMSASNSAGTKTFVSGDHENPLLWPKFTLNYTTALDEINITGAERRTNRYAFIDDKFSEAISRDNDTLELANQRLHVEFAENLTNTHRIWVYAKPINKRARLNIYEENSRNKLGAVTMKRGEWRWYGVTLKKLEGSSNDGFDLYVGRNGILIDRVKAGYADTLAPRKIVNLNDDLKIVDEANENVDLETTGQIEEKVVAIKTKDNKKIGKLEVNFENLDEDLDLKNLVAQTNIEEKKSVLHLPESDDANVHIDVNKTLYIPSSGKGRVYICPDAASLDEVHPKCPGKFWISVGETINNVSLTEDIIDGQRYYVATVTGTGGGEAGTEYTLWDSYVQSNMVSTNYGAETTLEVRADPTDSVIYAMFDISSVPVNQTIDGAQACFYLINDQASQTISSYHVNSWAGQTETSITWSNQPCGVSFDNSGNCNLTAESSVLTDGNQDGSWQCWTATNMVTKGYSEGDSNITLALRTTGAGNPDQYYSGDYSNASLIPYLNISYSEYNESACTEDWTVQYTDCNVSDQKIKYYADLNECGTTANLPGDNGTVEACDFCTPDLANTTWSDWSNISACGTNDTIQQRKELTQYDLYGCAEVENQTFYQYQDIACDYCVPDWSCSAYGDCNSSDQQPCDTATDANGCYVQTSLASDQYSGDYSEFSPQSCDFCTPSSTNTSWSEWEDISECNPEDTINQRRELTQYDSSFCGEISNQTFYEYQDIACDYCTPSLTNTSWSGWESISECYSNDTVDKRRSSIQYDTNSCGEVSNQTFYEYYSDTCDACTPSRINTSWSEWTNSGDCLTNDTQIQSRSKIQYDANECNEIVNQTFNEYQSTSCDYCTPDWYEINTSCQSNNLILGFYADTNSCYSATELESDNNAPANNNYDCVYATPVLSESESSSSSSIVRRSISTEDSNQMITTPTAEIGIPDAVASVGKVVKEITANIPVKLEVKDENIAILNIEISFERDLEDLIISTSALKQAPKKIGAPDKPVYQYLDISTPSVASSLVDSASISFAVTTDWIRENKIKQGTIRMEKFSAGEWTSLTTVLISESDQVLVFRSATPGFSYFAITGDKIEKPNDEAVDEDVSEDTSIVAEIPALSQIKISGSATKIFEELSASSGLMSWLVILGIGFMAIMLIVHSDKKRKRYKS